MAPWSSRGTQDVSIEDEGNAYMRWRGARQTKKHGHDGMAEDLRLAMRELEE